MSRSIFIPHICSPDHNRIHTHLTCFIDLEIPQKIKRSTSRDQDLISPVVECSPEHAWKPKM